MALSIRSFARVARSGVRVARRAAPSAVPRVAAPRFVRPAVAVRAFSAADDSAPIGASKVRCISFSVIAARCPKSLPGRVTPDNSHAFSRS